MNKVPVGLLVGAVSVSALLLGCGTRETSTPKFPADGEDSVREA